MLKFWRLPGPRLFSNSERRSSIGYKSSSNIGYNNNYSNNNGNNPNNDNKSMTSSITSSRIVQFGNEDFIKRIHSDHAAQSASSIRYQTFPRLGKLIRSFRPGELTVFTGPTGSGKTTVLAQLSLDYCFQGVKTLWGSFEIRNTRLARIMMEQVSGVRDTESEEFINEGEDETLSDNEEVENNLHSTTPNLVNAQNVLKQIPLYFMDYFGSVPLDSVLSCMDTAVTEHGIQHVILDNLQFMLSGQHSSSLDKFDLTDRSVASLRAFATSRNVHVTLVIHPRKELDDTPLGLASVSGTAKATQEADNVIILQKVGESRYLDVKKNRFDGELGTVRIRFNPKSRLIYEE